MCRDEVDDGINSTGTSPAVSSPALQPQSHAQPFTAFPTLFANEQSGQELKLITDFLATLNDGTSLQALLAPPLPPLSLIPTGTHEDLVSTMEEKFVLTAADPDGVAVAAESPEDRLARVIHAKFEAGLLKPYNYVSSYKKLAGYMEQHMLESSRHSILTVIDRIRPQFRAIAQSLTDWQLVLVEEHFERLLLEYDRVFSTMGIPACLWRRTGEIWKCNREFAKLVNLPMDQLSEGKTTIYELMQESSVVGYFEKYGEVAFDAGQKAVLTHCVLYSHDSKPVAGKKRKRAESHTLASYIHDDEEKEEEEEGRVTAVQCAFSYTIRRDQHGLPFMMVGNFLPSTTS